MHLPHEHAAEWKCAETGEYVYHPGTDCKPCSEFVSHRHNAGEGDASFKMATLVQENIWVMRILSKLFTTPQVKEVLKELIKDAFASSVSI
jgi:hypothetical protein